MPVQLPAGTPSLPPLGGRLFVAYRISWWALLALALTAAGLSWFDPATPTVIWVLRFVKSAVLVAVSAILFRRRATDAVAAMLALSFLLWTASSSVDFARDGATWPALLDRCRFLLFALALLLFPDGEWFPRWTRHVAAAIVATFFLGIAEAIGLLGTSLYLPLAIACVLLAIAALIASYRQRASTIQQQQAKWVALGLITGISLILAARAGAAITSQMAMPPFGAILLEGLFQAGIVVIALGFLTSLLRYRLYDAEAAISRSAVYAALTLALVATFAACEALIELVSQAYLGSAIGNVSGAAAAAIVAVMLTPLHAKLSGWAEQHFQHDLAVLKRELPELLIILSASVSVERLADAVLPRIEQAVQTTRAVLLVDGKVRAAQGISCPSARRLLRGWMAPEAVDLISRGNGDPFPLRMALRCPLGSVRGWLLLGPRPDGSYFGKDDLEALAEIAPSLQRTLYLVAGREADARRHRADQLAIRKALATLDGRVQLLERAGTQ